MPSTEVTIRQLGHTAAGVSSVRVSDQMINVLFVTVSNYINELFITHRHADRQGQRVLSVSVEVKYGCQREIPETNVHQRVLHVCVHFVKFVAGDVFG